MNIMFMTKFPDGTPTRFVDKILKGIVGSSYEVASPKLHTIRASKRIKKGMLLSLRTWSGKPYRSKQNEFVVTECDGTQDIKIESGCDDSGKFKWVGIYVDGKLLGIEESINLAINDGFESYDDFCRWFYGKEFKGQIIHWTDLRY